VEGVGVLSTQPTKTMTSKPNHGRITLGA